MDPGGSAVAQAVTVLLHSPGAAPLGTALGDSPVARAYRCLGRALDHDPGAVVRSVLAAAATPGLRDRGVHLLKALAIGCLAKPAGEPVEGPASFQAVVQGLADVLAHSDTDSKVLWAAAAAVRSLLEMLDDTLAGGASLLLPPGFELTMAVLGPCAVFIRPLLRLMQDKSSIAGGKRQPTKLTAAASDALCLLLALLAARGLGSDVVTDETQRAAAVLWDHVEVLEQGLRLWIEWNVSHRALYAAALEGLLGAFQRERDLKRKAEYHVYCDPRNAPVRASSDYALCLFWAAYGRLLMEDGGACLIRPQHRAAALHTAGNVAEVVALKDNAVVLIARLLHDIEPPSAGPGEAAQAAQAQTTAALLSIGLLLGRMGRKLGPFLDANDALAQALCDALLQRAFQHRDGVLQQMAAQILIHVLQTSSQTCTGGAEYFLQLLEERDGASRAAVLLVARYAVLHPQTVLPQLFGKLRHACRAVRANALDAIEELFRVVCAAVPATPAAGSSGVALATALLQAHPAVMRTVAEQLLGRLADEELALRAQAAGLFRFLAPPLVIPPLVGQLWHRDTRQRSAAHSALRHVLQSNTTDLAHVLELLDVLRGGAPPPAAPQTPADLARLCQAIPAVPGSDPPGEAADRPTVVFRYIGEWAAAVPPGCWPALVPQCLEAVLADPAHPHRVRLAATLAPHFPGHTPLVLRLLLAALERSLQPSEPEAAADAEAVVLQRLAPLLLLRTLPRQMLAQEAAGGEGEGVEGVAELHCLFDQLWERAFCPAELLELRRVSAELCGRFAAARFFPAALSALHRLLQDGPPFPAEVVLRLKLCLLGICHTLAVSTPAADRAALAGYCGQYVPLLLDGCLARLGGDVEGPEVGKLVLGCVECLAQTVVTQDLPQGAPAGPQIGNPTGPRPKVEVVAEEGESPCPAAEVLYSCLQALLQRLQDVEAAPYVVAVLQATTKMAAGQPLLLEALAARTVDALVRTANRAAKGRDWSIVAACLHVLFLLVFSLKQGVHPHVGPLGALAQGCLRHPQPAVRLGGLKLLGALMSAREDLFSFFSPDFLQDTCRALDALATLDSDRAVQGLASQLAHVFAPLHGGR